MVMPPGSMIPQVLLIIGLAAASVQAAASPALQRAVEAARASGYIEPAIIAVAEHRCETALCFAGELVERLPERIRLERAIHQDTDTIRWVRTAPSIEMVERDGNGLLSLRLPRFGRKAMGELVKLLERGAGEDREVGLEIDLRGNSGGDFERMLALAGLLIGPKPDVVEKRRLEVSEPLRLSGPKIRHWAVRRVMIDDATGSSALILARILTRNGGAALIGTDKKPEIVFLKHRVTIAHDWRLVLPIAEVFCLEN